MISVCIATYNGEKYILKQIMSVLEQLKINDEIIISDDYSSDKTIQIIENIQDPRIKIFKNLRSKGFVDNFENALTKATGDYIFLCDQDDIWLPNKVNTVLEKLKSKDLIIHDAIVVDANENEIIKSYFSLFHKDESFWGNFRRTRFLGCCMAFKRNVLNQCLPFPKGIVAHDYWIGMYSLLKFDVDFISTPLILYRRHGNNVSSSSGKSINNLFYKLITKRIGLIIAILLHSMKKKISKK